MSEVRKPKSKDGILRDAVLMKLRTQFTLTPDQRFMFAVIEQAIKDLSDKRESVRASAKSYFERGIVHAEICGVDADWVKRVLRKFDLI